MSIYALFQHGRPVVINLSGSIHASDIQLVGWGKEFAEEAESVLNLEGSKVVEIDEMTGARFNLKPFGEEEMRFILSKLVDGEYSVQLNDNKEAVKQFVEGATLGVAFVHPDKQSAEEWAEKNMTPNRNEAVDEALAMFVKQAACKGCSKPPFEPAMNKESPKKVCGGSPQVGKLFAVQMDMLGKDEDMSACDRRFNLKKRIDYHKGKLQKLSSIDRSVQNLEVLKNRIASKQPLGERDSLMVEEVINLLLNC